jgi:uncharacterized membrane protein
VGSNARCVAMLETFSKVGKKKKGWWYVIDSKCLTLIFILYFLFFT